MKRFLLAFLLAFFLSADGFSQINPVAPHFTGQVGVFPAIVNNPFTCSLSGLAATLTQCAAASAGLRYYITGMSFQTTTATAGTFSIQQGTGTNCGTNTAAIFPANATSARWTAPISTSPSAYIAVVPAKGTNVGYALCVIGTATNTINIEIWGYTER